MLEKPYNSLKIPPKNILLVRLVSPKGVFFAITTTDLRDKYTLWNFSKQNEWERVSQSTTPVKLYDKVFGKQEWISDEDKNE